MGSDHIVGAELFVPKARELQGNEVRNCVRGMVKYFVDLVEIREVFIEHLAHDLWCLGST